MAAPDYDAMDDEAETEEVDDEEDADASALDDELLMHAEAAGLDEAKAAAMKLFVERCVDLKSGGGYAEEPLDLDLEEPLV
jgi:hypothetical protein